VILSGFIQRRPPDSPRARVWHGRTIINGRQTHRAFKNSKSRGGLGIGMSMIESLPKLVSFFDTLMTPKCVVERCSTTRSSPASRAAAPRPTTAAVMRCRHARGLSSRIPEPPPSAPMTPWQSLHLRPQKYRGLPAHAPVNNTFEFYRNVSQSRKRPHSSTAAPEPRFAGSSREQRTCSWRSPERRHDDPGRQYHSCYGRPQRPDPHGSSSTGQLQHAEILSYRVKLLNSFSSPEARCS
jgi:hypothetical protein